MSAHHPIIVIGAGAAGMFAAATAAESGARVLLLEKMERPGRKLLLTGKGRCNLTNTAPMEEFLQHFGRNGRFLRPAFHQFFSGELIELFASKGLPCVTERGGRVFPADDSAAHVVQVMLDWLDSLNVEILVHAPVSQIMQENGQITGVAVGKHFYPASAVILAVGGASYPGTGSTGDGYALAKSLGHTIVPVRPALVPLITEGAVAASLQGLSLRNVAASLYIDNRKVASEFGEMLFTHFGLSGPIILSLSRQAVDALREKRLVEVSIDLKPALDETKLQARLLRDFDMHGKRQFQTILEDLLPRSLIPICIEQVGIPPDEPGNQISAAQRKRLQLWLKDFRFRISGHRRFGEAIITAGGVDVREVNPKTMQSRLAEGLFFAGEILDLDADTGGYNLQAAFSTGVLAGRSAAEFLQRGTHSLQP